MNLRGVGLVVALTVLAGTAGAQTFIREELRIPAPGAGSRGLEAIFVRPDLSGRLPLVVISHGSPSTADERRTATPHLYLRAAMEFARRGWAVGIVMRRGHGDSGGNYAEGSGPCSNSNYTVAANAAANDVRATIAHFQKRSDVDGSRVLAVGQSTGGFVTVALTANPPRGLVAAINFAGGRRAYYNGERCQNFEDPLLATFKDFGRRSRIPMLWIYSENDTYFSPDLAQRLRDAFAAGGGKVDLIKAPSFGKDGHGLFVLGTSQWTPYVDEFLVRQKLVTLESPISLPAPMPIAPPPQLNASGRKAFETFLSAPHHRAFAVSSTGSYGWQSSSRTAEDAKKAAIERCQKHASDCRLTVVNDAAAP